MLLSLNVFPGSKRIFNINFSSNVFKMHFLRNFFISFKLTARYDDFYKISKSLFKI